ncbi:cyclin-dependent kinase 7 [Nematocida sp. AWRm77]|nr:cyclin-dependent kinase 7 [Nematocida sp. AWRm77]
MEKLRRYTKEDKIGEGTYAVIYSGKEYFVDGSDAKEEIITNTPPLNAIPGRKIAVKKIKRAKGVSGVDLSAVREIKHLKRISAEHVIEILDVFVQDNAIHIVLPYMESNLEVIIRSKNLVFMPQDVKSWMLMVCQGLRECHARFILHRDIKPNNILIGKDGQAKLADFGISTDFGFPVRQMTNPVVTRWYKAPELLLGGTNYSFGVDIWALGCLFAELFLRTPYLPGTDDIHQLELIYKALGTPSTEDWPELMHLPWYKEPAAAIPPPDFSSLFSAVGEDGLDLLKQMLVYNPAKRISIEGILSHRYFQTSPRPTRPDLLPFDTLLS